MAEPKLQRWRNLIIMNTPAGPDEAYAVNRCRQKATFSLPEAAEQTVWAYTPSRLNLTLHTFGVLCRCVKKKAYITNKVDDNLNNTQRMDMPSVCVIGDACRRREGETNECRRVIFFFF